MDNTIELHQQTVERKILDRELFLGESMKTDKTMYAVGSRDELPWGGSLDGFCGTAMLRFNFLTTLVSHSTPHTHFMHTLYVFHVAVKQLLGEAHFVEYKCNIKRR